MADRWEQIARRRRGAGPRYPLIEPLRALSARRGERLRAGVEPYYPPLRLVLTKDTHCVFAVEEGKGDGYLFATPTQPITRGEAYLAGAYGREGVEKCLNMTIAAARRAGASVNWVETNIEAPVLARMREEFGRARGRPVEVGQASEEANRKRIARRVERGEAALDEYFGPDWPRLLIPSLRREEEGNDGD